MIDHSLGTHGELMLGVAANGRRTVDAEGHAHRSGAGQPWTVNWSAQEQKHELSANDARELARVYREEARALDLLADNVDELNDPIEVAMPAACMDGGSCRW